MSDAQLKFVIRLERANGNGAPVVTWLSGTLPVRWGPRENAMIFTSMVEAQRAAAAIPLSGAWFIARA